MDYYTILQNYCHENDYPEPKLEIECCKVKEVLLYKCSIVCIIDNVEYIGVSNICLTNADAINQAIGEIIRKTTIEIYQEEVILPKNNYILNNKSSSVLNKLNNKNRPLKTISTNSKVRELHSSVKDSVEMHDTLPTLYFMDLENIPMKYLPNPNSFYIGFIREATYIRRYDNWYALDKFEELHKIDSNKILIKIKGDEKELCDHFITAYISYCIEFLKNNNLPIVIVSRDKCVYAIAKCFKYVLNYNKLPHTVRILTNLQ